MVSSIHDIPGNHVAMVPFRAHAAATATELVAIFRAPFACKIVSVVILWDAAITGVDTNTTHVNLHNRGTAGTGTTELGALDYTDALDASQFVAASLYAPAAPLAIASGVILALQLEKIGTGLALPDGTAIITYTAN